MPLSRIFGLLSSSFSFSRREKVEDLIPDWPQPRVSFQGRRPLTPFSPGKPEPHTSLQEQSPLFQLPPEIRHEIWKFVAATRPIKLEGVWEVLYTRAGEIRHCEEIILRAAYRPAIPPFQTSIDGIRGWETGALCSCRRLYFELLPVLLLSVKLFTVKPAIMCRLPKMVPQHRVQQLTDVKFEGSFTYGPLSLNGSLDRYINRERSGRRYRRRQGKKCRQVEALLRGVCSALASMTGLQRVELVLDAISLWSNYWVPVDHEVLELVDQARKGRPGWLLIVNWPPKDGDERLYDSGFRIERVSH